MNCDCTVPETTANYDMRFRVDFVSQIVYMDYGSSTYSHTMTSGEYNTLNDALSLIASAAPNVDTVNLGTFS